MPIIYLNKQKKKKLTNGFGARLCPLPIWGTSCLLAANEVFVTGGILFTGACGWGDGILGVTGDTLGRHVPPPLEYYFNLIN